MYTQDVCVRIFLIKDPRGPMSKAHLVTGGFPQCLVDSKKMGQKCRHVMFPLVLT